MQNSGKVIELSKKKIILLTLCSFGLVTLGFWLLNIATSKTDYPQLFMIVTAFASIAFFGMCGIYGMIKIFDNRPGIIISRTGFLDNSNAINGQFIKWDNVLGTEHINIHGTRLLLIYVDNMEELLKIAGPWKRFWMKLNIKWYGTPISLSSHSLKCNFDELRAIVEEYIEKHTHAEQSL